MKKWLIISLLATIALSGLSCSQKVEKMKEGEEIHGFILKKKEFIQDHDSTVYYFEHKKTGAKLVNMKNNDSNRVFAIAFNTFPHDHTGKAHILEHSVLMGSKKFPSKDTFEELKKGSFNTYLNAFTSADMTTYPVATINSKEFKNLMHVYLDAVFFPQIHGDPNIIKQEGIRLEYDNASKQLEYKGVVFNEMKGALGDAQSQARHLTQKALFPNSTYSYVSGGDPKFIPDLTQESLTNFHLQFYHPTNSYTFIYGDEQIEDHLKFIDQQYFSRFEKKAVKMENRFVEPIAKPARTVGYYGINANESQQGKYNYSKVFLLTPAAENEDSLGLSLLSRLLTKNQTSPLAKALIDAGLGTQVYAYKTNHLPWNTFHIAADKTDANKVKIFEKVIQQTLEKLATTGFNPDVVEGEIRNYEFYLREMDVGRTPMGIEILDGVTRSLAYDMDIFDELKYLQRIEKLKEQVKDKTYFQGLIKKYLLDNSRNLILEMRPQVGLSQQEDREERKKLDKLYSALKPEQLSTIKKETQDFAEYQSRPSRPEDLAKIPTLTLNDIEDKQEEIPQSIIKNGESTLLYYPLHTKGITYLDINFDMSFLPESKIPYASLILHLLENLRTKNLSLELLQQQKALHTGFAYNRAQSTEYFAKDGYNPRFKYIVGTLDENLSKSMEFINEIVVNTDYRDYRELEHFLKTIQAELEQSFMYNPGDIASGSARAMMSSAGAYNNALSGYPFYLFIKNLNQNFKKQKEQIAKNLEETASLIFHQRNLIVGITASEANKEHIVSKVQAFIANLPAAKELQAITILPAKRERLGIIVPGKVQYVALMGPIAEKSEVVEGSLDVLMQVLENEFLHPEIRQKGGAYGAYAYSGLKGDITFFSYRDPNLAKTLETYRQAPKFLNSFSFEEKILEKYIIGTVKDFDAPKSNKQKGAAMLSRFLFNYTLKDRAAYRQQIINATPKQLRSYASRFEKMLDNNIYAVAGSEEVIKQNAQYFDRIIYLFE